MKVTNQEIASLLTQYMNHTITRESLIAQCEEFVQERTFESRELQNIVARIGWMDVHNFDVSFDDLTTMVQQLGYHLVVEMV